MTNYITNNLILIHFNDFSVIAPTSCSPGPSPNPSVYKPILHFHSLPGCFTRTLPHTPTTKRARLQRCVLCVPRVIDAVSGSFPFRLILTIYPVLLLLFFIPSAFFRQPSFYRDADSIRGWSFHIKSYVIASFSSKLSCSVYSCAPWEVQRQPSPHHLRVQVPSGWESLIHSGTTVRCILQCVSNQQKAFLD